MDQFAILFLVTGLAWVGIAVAVGLLGERRGSSALLWFALAIFASPIVALILLLIVTQPGGGRGRT